MERGSAQRAAQRAAHIVEGMSSRNVSSVTITESALNQGSVETQLRNQEHKGIREGCSETYSKMTGTLRNVFWNRSKYLVLCVGLPPKEPQQIRVFAFQCSLERGAASSNSTLMAQSSAQSDNIEISPGCRRAVHVKSNPDGGT